MRTDAIGLLERGVTELLEVRSEIADVWNNCQLGSALGAPRLKFDWGE